LKNIPKTLHAAQERGATLSLYSYLNPLLAFSRPQPDGPAYCHLLLVAPIIHEVNTEVMGKTFLEHQCQTLEAA